MTKQSGGLPDTATQVGWVTLAHVRGRGKLSTGGHVEVPGFGQLEVPILRSSCRRGVRAPGGDRDGGSQSQSPPGRASQHEVCEGEHGRHRCLPAGGHVSRGCRDVRDHA
jgi:hypothetical protein